MLRGLVEEAAQVLTACRHPPRDGLEREEARVRRGAEERDVAAGKVGEDAHGTQLQGGADVWCVAADGETMRWGHCCKHLATTTSGLSLEMQYTFTHGQYSLVQVVQKRKGAH